MPVSNANISVIVPCKNDFHLIPELVNNLNRQSLLPSEVIIVDDHSLEKQIYNPRFQKSAIPVRVISNTGRGISAARNTGITFSSGKYLSFLDADDRWHPDKLYRQIELMDLYSVQAACSAYRFITECGNLVHERTSKELVIKRRDVLSDRAAVLGSASAVIASRELVKRAGYFDEDLLMAEDLDYWLRLLSFTNMVIVPEFLVQITKRSRSSYHGQEDSIRSKLEIASVMKVLLKHSDEPSLIISRFTRLVLTHKTLNRVSLLRSAMYLLSFYLRLFFKCVRRTFLK